MTDDIVRIDGVEIEIDYDYLRTAIKCGLLRPKRKQTGWVCRNCTLAPDFGPCVRITTCKDAPTHCIYSDSGAHWQPFYGKVVE